MDARTVLLIAGSNESAASYQSAFEEAGMSVLRAADGLTGMRDALGEQPDIVVLDFAADEAPDVLRARRALRGAGIPLLVLVGGHVADAARPADAAGITFLLAPAEPALLVAETIRAIEAAGPARKRAQDDASQV